MGKIIQRDFFPDLEKLKAQNDYLEAMEKNDTIKLRQLHMKYSGKKPPSQRSTVIHPGSEFVLKFFVSVPSPATFETPAHMHNQSNNDGESVINCDNNEKSEKKLSLDQYLNSHTSQDNESFEEILTESAKKHRQKYSYLYNEEEKSVEENKKLLALPSIEQQCALPEKKLDVDTWPYKNKNYIMYVPDGVELSEEQVKEINNKRQQINHTNTRLVNNPFNEVQSKETINELARTQAKVLTHKHSVWIIIIIVLFCRFWTVKLALMAKKS